MTGTGSTVEHTGRAIREQVRVEAPPQVVYRAWTDPDRLTSWFVGEMDGRVEVGETVTWRWGKADPGMVQRVLIAEPPHRFATVMSLPQGETLLEVTIDPVEGGSLVRLVQSGYGEGPEWDAEYEAMLSGWMIALAILRFVVKRWLGRPRREIVVLADASFEPEEIRTLQRTEGGISSWLGRSKSGAGSEGRPVRLELDNGRILTGTVLRTTSTEAAWSWEEIDGVVEIKAFRTARWGSKVGLRVSSWMEKAGDLVDLEGWAESAVEKLVEALGD